MFTHLHVHSDFSLLDGAASVKKLVARAKELGMEHLAITDHGNMFGALRFYDECKANDINPIVGCEVYVAAKSRKIRSGSEGENRYNHMVLLAKNENGYKNLMKMVSKGYTEGFYYKPRVDDELLEQYHEDLICLSACLGGIIPYLILQNRHDEAEEKALYYNKLFGEGNFYLEIQDHGIAEQKTVNEALIKMSKKLNIPLVATNDLHYIMKEHARAQEVLICIGTKKKLSDTNRMSFHGTEFYMKSAEEMAELFSYVPEAISNTMVVAEKCNLELHLPGPLLPIVDIPEPFKDDGEYLRHLTYEGLKMRYPEVTPEIKERADFELNIIISMKFPSYFLIVWDFIHYAKQNDIPVGPGRGSGAGSIVAYALTITDIDPLKYSLLFERFLNPERVSMPDFDIDFCFERRQEVIDYVTHKYGVDKVGQIITFGTLKAKAVIRDVARVLDIPFAESNEITKLIPDDLKITIPKALEQEPKLVEIYERGGVYKDLIEISKTLEGLNRHASTHAAGVVIGQEELTEYVPLYRDAKTGAISTEFTMDLLEPCGLVKMDFLGLKTLTLIKNAEKLVRLIEPDFDIETASEEDETTYKMLGEGKSICIFQFESAGMQKILKDAQPSNIEDLIALNALYRPGPMANIPQFIESKHGRQEIVYPDPLLEEVLKPTYGVIVYQEQVMQIAQIIGGFSLGKADILRRAMGKKKVKEMDRMKIEFCDGAVAQGLDKNHAAGIFDMLAPFAGYGFNKSHAAAYSVLAYKTAYLKANYPAEFMAANLTNEINDPKKLASYIDEVKALGLKILPPDINLSDKNFTVVNNDIVYGMMGIKGMGAAAVDEILRARNEGGHFTDLNDFLLRVELKTVNKKVIETGIMCGLFDCFEMERGTMLHNLEALMEYASKKKDSTAHGQTSLFADAPEEEFPEVQIRPAEDIDEVERLKLEKEILGFYFSGHPMDRFQDIWQRATNIDLTAPEKARENETYTIVGILKEFRAIQTKAGKRMAFALIEDYKGVIELIFFPDIFNKTEPFLQDDRVVMVSGKIEKNRGEPKILVEDVQEPYAPDAPVIEDVHIRLANRTVNEEELYQLKSHLFKEKGDSQLYIHIPLDMDTEKIVKVSTLYKIKSGDSVLHTFKQHPHIQDAWAE